MKITKTDDGGYEVELDYSWSMDRSWGAKLIGADEKYRFQRDFMKPKKVRSRSKKTGKNIFRITEAGYYEFAERGLNKRITDALVMEAVEWHDCSPCMGRAYFRLMNGILEEIKAVEVVFASVA